MWSIKVRERGKRAWLFVGAGEDATRLRIRAARWPDRAAAEAALASLAKGNPELEFKAVAPSPGAS